MSRHNKLYNRSVHYHESPLKLRSSHQLPRRQRSRCFIHLLNHNSLLVSDSHRVFRHRQTQGWCSRLDTYNIFNIDNKTIAIQSLLMKMFFLCLKAGLCPDLPLSLFPPPYQLFPFCTVQSFSPASLSQALVAFLFISIPAGRASIYLLHNVISPLLPCWPGLVQWTGRKRLRRRQKLYP